MAKINIKIVCFGSSRAQWHNCPRSYLIFIYKTEKETSKYCLQKNIRAHVLEYADLTDFL